MKRRTQKFIKIRAAKTNVVRPSGIQSTGLASDGSLGTGPSKLVDHEVAKSLKVSCLCLAIVTVINSATFGGLIPSLVSHFVTSCSLSLSLSLSL